MIFSSRSLSYCVSLGSLETLHIFEVPENLTGALDRNVQSQSLRKQLCENLDSLPSFSTRHSLPGSTGVFLRDLLVKDRWTIA